MKIVYQQETKRVPDSLTYDELMDYCAEIFNYNQEEDFLSLFYVDNDGDLISVSSQSDLELSLKDNQKSFKFALAHNENEARELLLQGCLAFNNFLFKAIVPESQRT